MHEFCNIHDYLWISRAKEGVVFTKNRASFRGAAKVTFAFEVSRSLSKSIAATCFENSRMVTRTSWTFGNLQFAIRAVLQKYIIQHNTYLSLDEIVVFAWSVRVLYEPAWVSSISRVLFLMYKSTMVTTSLLHIHPGPPSPWIEQTASCNGDARFVLVPEPCNLQQTARKLVHTFYIILSLCSFHGWWGWCNVSYGNVKKYRINDIISGNIVIRRDFEKTQRLPKYITFQKPAFHEGLRTSDPQHSQLLQLYLAIPENCKGR